MGRYCSVTFIIVLMLYAPQVFSQKPKKAPAAKNVKTTAQKSAQEEPPQIPQEQETDPAKIKAKEHFDKGLILVEQENWEAALLEFEESLKLTEMKSAALNRAMCLKALHRYLEALDAFKGYLEKHGPELDETRRAEAEKNIVELKALLGALTVKVNVPGAKIIIDGKEKGEGPLMDRLQLGPGYHNVKVEAPGFIPDDRDIQIVSGAQRVLDVFLVKAPRVGTVTVESNVEGADVVIDGKEAGSAPFTGELDEGRHTILVKKDGHRSYSLSIDLKTNQSRLVSATLGAVRTLDPAWFWGGVGMTAAWTAATIALGASVVALDKQYDPFTSSREDYDTGRRLMIAADVSLGLALGSAAVSLALFFFTDWKKRPLKIGKEKREAGLLWGPGFAMVEF
jgi:hypothetical protein